MLDTKVQTPISGKVLTKARERASDMGFSSINDVIRIVVKQFAEGNIDFSIAVPVIATEEIPYVDRKEQNEIENLLEDSHRRGTSKIGKKKTITL